MPERRPDKTGKVVTRHVKTHSVAPSIGNVPAPMSTPKQDAAKIAQRLGRGNTETRKAVRDKLNSLEMRPTSMQLLKNVTENADNRTLDRLKSTVLIGDESYIRRTLYFHEVEQQDYSSSANIGMIVKYIDPPTDEDGNEAEIRGLVAMAHGIATVADRDWLMTGNTVRVSEVHFENSDMVDLFVTNPERAVEMSMFMRRKRGVITVEDMNTYLKVHSSLADGVL